MRDWTPVARFFKDVLSISKNFVNAHKEFEAKQNAEKVWIELKLNWNLNKYLQIIFSSYKSNKYRRVIKKLISEELKERCNTKETTKI